MQKHIAQADLNWTVGRVTAAMLLTGTVALLVLVQSSWVPLWVATGGAWLFAILPYLYIMKRRAKRFNQFRENFPDAMDSLSRALKAGYPFIAALDMVANETLPPVSTEMRRTFAEATLGIPLERALANLGDRVPILEVNLFAAAIHLHSRTGGKLSDVMATLSENMREQVALRGEVRAIAAHGRLTGIILTIIPIAIAVLMAVVSPTYIGILLAHPYGKHLIAGAALCLITAHFVIRRIVDIKV
jgi:tight adherence protein B